MNTDREKTERQAGLDSSTAPSRQEWERPTLRKLGAAEAEAGARLHFDGSSFSS